MTVKHLGFVNSRRPQGGNDSRIRGDMDSIADAVLNGSHPLSLPELICETTRSDHMEKQCIAVPGISEMLAISGVPLSPAVKAGSLVCVSGMPPIDRDSGKIVEGGI